MASYPAAVRGFYFRVWQDVDIFENVKKISEIEEQLKKLKVDRAKLLKRAKKLEDHKEVQRVIRTYPRQRYNPFTESSEPWIINRLKPFNRYPVSGEVQELSDEKRAELVKKYRQEADNLTQYKIDPLEKYLKELKESTAGSVGTQKKVQEENDESSRTLAALNEGFILWNETKYRGARTIAGNMVREKFPEVKEFEEGKTKFGRKLLTKEFKDLRERIRKGIERRKPSTKRKGRKSKQ